MVIFRTSVCLPEGKQKNGGFVSVFFLAGVFTGANVLGMGRDQVPSWDVCFYSSNIIALISSIFMIVQSQRDIILSCIYHTMLISCPQGAF